MARQRMCSSSSSPLKIQNLLWELLWNMAASGRYAGPGVSLMRRQKRAPTSKIHPRKQTQAVAGRTASPSSRVDDAASRNARHSAQDRFGHRRRALIGRAHAGGNQRPSGGAGRTEGAGCGTRRPVNGLKKCQKHESEKSQFLPKNCVSVQYSCDTVSHIIYVITVNIQ